MGCVQSQDATRRRHRDEVNREKLRRLATFKEEALEREAAEWLEADDESRAVSRPPRHDAINPWRVAPPPDKPAWRSGKRKTGDVRFVDEEDVVYTPTNDDVGPQLFREMHFTGGEFSDMFRERKLLAIKAARYVRQHPNDLFNADGTPKPVVPGESRRGMGISPWEQAILGNRHARNERIAREHQKIFKYQRQASAAAKGWEISDSGRRVTPPTNASTSSDDSKSKEVPATLYDAVAQHATNETSCVFQINQENAAAAHELAVKEHELLVAAQSEDKPRADIFTRLSGRPGERRAKCRAKAKRRGDTKLHPTRRDEDASCRDEDGCDPDDDPLEHVHTDQFVNLIRADSFNNHEASRAPGETSP
mmetsp:Transcript_9017/g.28191  ORF Transcript_9017/g.28191 Transcript_9017/m.28191 type:complete len:365 (+) Transcript_9017:332-1426(+)